VAKDIVKTAEAESEHIRSRAEEGARSILSRAEDKEKEMQEEAVREGQAASLAAEQMLAKSRNLAESEIKAKFGKIYEEMLSTLEVGGIQQVDNPQ
jgi:vacuolar-type H+-ATPase subunit E/Vma4